jgi:hypothetical protein
MAIPVVIDGLTMHLVPPTGEQMMAMQLLDSPVLPEGSKIKIAMELLMALIDGEDDRAHVALAFARNQFTVKEFTETLQAIATTQPTPVDLNAPREAEKPAPKVPPRARKTAAKKTPAKR